MLLLLSFHAKAQDAVWTLQSCIDYALQHNLTVKQSELDKRLSEVNLNSAKMELYPSLNLSTNSGLNLGRSITPTTNQFENTQFSYAGLNASSGVLLFGWFRKRYNAQKSGLQLQQTNERYEQLKDDIALNISTAYLRALLAKEQIGNIRYQIEVSTNNLIRIEKLLNAGKSNMLELSQAETQLSGDSSLYLQAILNEQQALIELQTLLNLDYSNKITLDYRLQEDVFALKKMDPEAVYQEALGNYHSIRSSEYGIAIAQKQVRISKAAGLPSVNLFYSTGTNYSSSFYEYLPSGDKQLMNFGRQINSNFSHAIGIGLSIPVFNNFNSRNSIKTSQINLHKASLAHLEAKQKLRKDIYIACTDYELTLQKFYNAKSISLNSERAFNAATIRYESGLITNFEYLTEKNNFLKAQNEASALKYELQFKKMQLDCYRSSCGE